MTDEYTEWYEGIKCDCCEKVVDTPYDLVCIMCPNDTYVFHKGCEKTGREKFFID